MGRKNLRRIVLFGGIVLAGLLVVQGFWLKQAFNMEERQFDHSIQVALMTIADTLSADDTGAGQTQRSVRQLTSNFFFAELNSPIDPTVLAALLKKELGARSIIDGYELGIYRAEDDTLVYGTYVPATLQFQLNDATGLTGTETADKSNFAIYFPNKFPAIAGKMNIWIFSTLVLILMVTFFAYAIFTLLKEKRLSELKEDFLNNLTHEFQTPIANIGLASDSLCTHQLDTTKQEQYLGIIHDENQRLKVQVEQILQIGTLDKKGLNLEPRPVNVHELVRKLTASMRMRIKQKAGRLSIALDASQSEVLADEFHLTNTVSNLLDNAEKYANGNPDISITTSNKKRGILISIKDAGIGIKEGLQQFVFDKFFRVPTGNRHNVKGFGLGLNYVKTVVEAHGGTITLKSKPGHGACFDIYLPFH